MAKGLRLYRPADEAGGGQLFSSLEELIAARRQIPGPVLVEAPMELAVALLEHLRDEDDVRRCAASTTSPG